MQRANDTSSILANAVIGAAAGAAAVWVMDRVDWFNFLHEDPQARRRTQAVRPGGMDPAHVAADQIATAMGRELEPRDNNLAGKAVHYSIGIAPAAIYGALRHQVPSITAGRGSLFGLGLFLAQDEGLNALTGLSASPGKYPWQAHARGLVAHLVYGLVLDAALNVADRLTEGSSGADHRPVRADGPQRPWAERGGPTVDQGRPVTAASEPPIVVGAPAEPS